jgi:hypothetical protein
MIENLIADIAENVIKSDSTVYDPPLAGLIILPGAAGSELTIENEQKQNVIVVVRSPQTAPTYIQRPIRKVLATNSTMGDSNIFGVR